MQYEQELEAAFQQHLGLTPIFRGATKPDFGHFQTNIALVSATRRSQTPRELAQQMAEAVNPLEDYELTVAGPGFINVTVKTERIAADISNQYRAKNLGLSRTATTQTVVIDYSAPNVAKQLHVGHLRTTIIGDSLARILKRLGHNVIPQNHIGDWGTQFGMLIQLAYETGETFKGADLTELDSAYKAARARFIVDPIFAENSRRRVVDLQSGDQYALLIWRTLLDVSREGFDEVYRRLHVLLRDEHILGESYYNNTLAEMADDLERKKIAIMSAGALCAFTDGYEAPLMIRKSDGGFGYDATDVAAVKYRAQTLKANRIIYVTDVRQSAHFQQVFEVTRRAGYIPDHVTLEHVGYGMVLGTTGQPLKSRDGGAPLLANLLDAAESRVTPNVALAAIKYADLSGAIQNDYVFDVDRMTQTQGDTGPYLQYAHARLSALMKKASDRNISIAPDTAVSLNTQQELHLAFTLLQYGEIVTRAGSELQPSILCSYLYSLSTAVSRFYEHNPILNEQKAVRDSRLVLAHMSQQVLWDGLALLGISAPEEM